MIAVPLALGLVIGGLIGLLGGGGSVLAVPALVYLAGLSLPSAVATSLLVVGLSAVVAVLPRLRDGRIEWRIAVVFGAAGATTAVAGAALNRQLPDEVVLGLFALLMVAVGIRMLRAGPSVGLSCSTSTGAVDWRHCLPRTLAGGLAVGFLTGLLGVGGGFLIIPVLVVALGVPMDRAIGTSLVVVAVNSAAGFAAHAGGTPLDLPVTSAFTAAAVLAALVTARLGRGLDTPLLTRWFGRLVLAVAAFVAIQLAVDLLGVA